MNWKYSTQKTRFCEYERWQKVGGKIANQTETIKWIYEILKIEQNIVLLTENWIVRKVNETIYWKTKNDNKKKETSARRRWIFEESFIAVQYRYGNLFILLFFSQSNLKFYLKWEEESFFCFFCTKKWFSNLSNNCILSATTEFRHRNIVHQTQVSLIYSSLWILHCTKWLGFHIN